LVFVAGSEDSGEDLARGGRGQRRRIGCLNPILCDADSAISWLAAVNHGARRVTEDL
jgi:hypothetical protein